MTWLDQLSKQAAIEAQEAQRLVEAAKQKLQGKADRIAAVGSLARNHPTVGDVDLLVIPSQGHTAGSIRKELGQPYNVFGSTPETWETGVLHWAPGKQILRLKALAKQKGYRLNQHGLFDQTGQLASQNAKEISDKLGEPLPNPVSRILSSGE